MLSHIRTLSSPTKETASPSSAISHSLGTPIPNNHQSVSVNLSVLDILYQWGQARLRTDLGTSGASEVNLGVRLSELRTLSLRQGLSLETALGQLVSGLQCSSCICYPSNTGTTIMCYQAWLFTWEGLEEPEKMDDTTKKRTFYHREQICSTKLCNVLLNVDAGPHWGKHILGFHGDLLVDPQRSRARQSDMGRVQRLGSHSLPYQPALDSV